MNTYLKDFEALLIQSNWVIDKEIHIPNSPRYPDAFYAHIDNINLAQPPFFGLSQVTALSTNPGIVTLRSNIVLINADILSWNIYADILSDPIVLFTSNWAHGYQLQNILSQLNLMPPITTYTVGPLPLYGGINDANTPIGLNSNRKDVGGV